jgi:hypothetical protein
MKPKVTLVAVDLFARIGGPAKTVSEIADALDARVICFVRPTKENLGPFSVAPTVVVSCRTGKLAKRFALSLDSEGFTKAEALILDSDIVFIHSFFLQHALWAAKTARRLGKPYVTCRMGYLIHGQCKKVARSRRRISGSEVDEPFQGQQVFFARLGERRKRRLRSSEGTRVSL